MKKYYKFLFALTLMIVLVLYKDNLAAATAEEQNMDSVSTGAALTEWLEAHKNTGGKDIIEGIVKTAASW